MVITIDWDELKVKTENWLNARKWELKRFWYNHQQEIIVFGPMIIGTGGAIIKKLIRTHNLRLEEQLT